MAHKVLNDFIAKEHNDELYQKGDIYPKPAYKATKARIEFLKSIHPKYGVAFLESENNETKSNKTATESGD